jgi:hypothetical protein
LITIYILPNSTAIELKSFAGYHVLPCFSAL